MYVCEHSTPCKSGALNKLDHKGKKWQKRWYVLYSTSLAKFNGTLHDSECTGTVNLFDIAPGSVQEVQSCCAAPSYSPYHMPYHTTSCSAAHAIFKSTSVGL